MFFVLLAPIVTVENFTAGSLTASLLESQGSSYNAPNEGRDIEIHCSHCQSS